MDTPNAGCEDCSGPSNVIIQNDDIASNMKIAYDHQIFGWQAYGGISRYFYELANNIAKSGDSEVLVVSPLYVNFYLKERVNSFRVIGRKVLAIRRSGRVYRAINQLFAPKIMKSYVPDIVHETYYSNVSVAPKGCKVVVTVCDMVHELYPESFSTWDSTAREKAIAVERADHIICISENTKSDLVKILNVDPEKISVVHLGFSLTQEARWKELGQAETDTPYILYVGSRGGYKNFTNLLTAFAADRGLYGEFQLVAFGGGPFTAGERILIAKLGLPLSRVRQLSGDDDMLADLYRGAAVFVYPSLYEGFGIPPLEAMSFDCPVACSNSSSIPEVVGDAALLFDPNSVQAITNALNDLINNIVLRDTLVARGRERIKLFSWSRCSEQTLKVYNALLK